MQQIQSHPSDLPLGGQVFHGIETVKIFGRERDQKTGKVETYWVVNSKGRRYQVAAKRKVVSPNRQHTFLHTETESGTEIKMIPAKKPKKRKGNPEWGIQAKSNVSCLIGIDPGTNTGLAIKESGLFRIVETGKIWWALNVVKEWAEYHGKQNTLVRFEDARLRKWFGNSGPEKWKGAGSIMRDCAIWEEALTALGIPFEKVPPKHVKETTAAQFQKLTGWYGRTSIHAREAAWLVLPYLKNI